MFNSKSILIISDAPGNRRELGSILNGRGFKTSFLTFDTISDNRLPVQTPKCIIIEIRQYEVDFRNAIDRVRSKFPAANIPVLALVNSIPPFEIDCIDSVLLQPCHPVQIATRISALIRLAEMETEIALRLETLTEDFGIRNPKIPTNQTRKLSILFIGKASPEFMVIINALQKQNVSVIAAFTSFTAFDYLYEKSFDAVVMNGLNSTEPAYSVVEAMRKNAKLFHVPAMLLVKNESVLKYNTAFEKGMSDVIDAGAPIEETRTRLLEQANFHQTHEVLKSKFSQLGGSASTDAVTGLYNNVFFNAHLKRVHDYCKVQNLPISVCLIRVKYDNDVLNTTSLASAYKQVGGMIKNLLRMQDIIARLDTNLFAIAFPGQSAEELSSVSSRLESILKCASITDPLTGAVLNIKLEITVNTIDEAQEAYSAA